MSLEFNSEISFLLEVVRSCLGNGKELYLVGGGVRDALMGSLLHDLDFAMPEDPTPLAKCVANRLKAGFFVLDDERHTARVVNRMADHCLFPLDFVQFTGDNLSEDLQKRDFTINAIAVSLSDHLKIIDPLNGQEDLRAGLLRVCNFNSLLDDPVRVLRGVRLAMQFGFSYASGLEKLMQEAAPNLPKTSYERQRDEFFKILVGPNPSKGMAQLHHFKVFKTLIPSLETQEAIPASLPNSSSKSTHSFSVVDFYDQLLNSILSVGCYEKEKAWWISYVVSELKPFSENIKATFSEEITSGRTKRGLALLGALLHDIDKPLIMPASKDGLLLNDDHDVIGANLAWEAAKRLKLSNAESDWIRIMVCYHRCLIPLMGTEERPNRRTIYHFFAKTDEVGVAIALLSLADIAATYSDTLSKEKWTMAVQVAKDLFFAWWNHRGSVVSPELLLDGNDLQSLFELHPGQQIGYLLEVLREAQASGEVVTRKDAINFVRSQLLKKEN